MKLSRHIELENIPNCRDLGGITNKDGRKIKPNKIFRSNYLMDASEKDIKALLELGLTDILDLRGDNEFLNLPDPKIEGVKIHHLPMSVLDKNDWDKHEHYPHASYLIENRQMDYLQEWLYVYADCSANALMEHGYSKAIERDEMREQFAKALRIFLEAEGAVDFHCQDGKDRTGLLAMLILKLLKVDNETIRQEYILSKKYLQNKIMANYQLCLDHNVPEPLLSELKTVQGCELSWIDSAIRKFEELGGYPTYFIESLGLKEEEIKAFQNKFLE